MNKEQPKARLVRGIDPIPENWELASALLAIGSLSRSRTILARLKEEALQRRDHALHRDLAKIETAIRRGLDNITGGFTRSEVEPKAAECEAAEREVDRRRRAA